MLVKYLFGLIINSIVFILLFYSTIILSLFAYPVLSPIICSVIGYKLTKKWWFGFLSFFSLQVLYFGIYRMVELKGPNESFIEQIYYTFFSSKEGRWLLVTHIFALFISFVTSIITYWWTKRSQKNK